MRAFNVRRAQVSVGELSMRGQWRQFAAIYSRGNAQRAGGNGRRPVIVPQLLSYLIAALVARASRRAFLDI
jgi:hypothetical protein